ncbi:LOB domain-containing protein 24-like protein [Tanacetum coccineum]
MTSTRCAVCKYFRRRCPPECIFAPYFPANNPQRFAYVHRLYGASNVGKMLEELPVHLRGDAMEALCYEAKSQSQLTKTQAEIALLHASVGVVDVRKFY